MMRYALYPVGLVTVAALATMPATAQTPAVNNIAYIYQVSAAGGAAVVNVTTFLQGGSGNRLGSENQPFVQNATAAGLANCLIARQTSSGNLIGFLLDGSTAVPLWQRGTGNLAVIAQEGGDRNVIGALQQTSGTAQTVTNDLAVTERGAENALAEIDQQHTGGAKNAALVILTGQRNGYAAGTPLPNESRSGALSGLTGLSELRFIGTPEALLPLSTDLDGVTAYTPPSSTLGASLRQSGSGNRAEITVAGNDNSFIVNQNSRPSAGIQAATLTNGVVWAVAGSSNGLFTLQAGAGNAITGQVVGEQNALLIYQAGEAGAVEAGYGNIVLWRQGATSGDIQNVAEFVQRGSSNTVAGAQIGSLNVAHGVQQGIGHVAIMVQVGNANIANIRQTGSSNTVVIRQGEAAAAYTFIPR